MYLRICGSFKSSKNNWVRKSQICKSQKYTVGAESLCRCRRKVRYLKRIYHESQKYLKALKINLYSSYADLFYSERSALKKQYVVC
jgi:hypothetical protein